MFNPDELQNPNEKKIRILDRFNIILSIFAQRAKSKASQLEVELAYLKYAKARLARGGHANYESLYGDFKGDFFRAQTAEMEVVSAKQSGQKGSIGGSGETQLEVEKRRIGVRESQIKEMLIDISKRRGVEREHRREIAEMGTPTLALLGYTNAGKTALMNKVAQTKLESQNKLFQTLTTTIKKYSI